MEAAAFHGSRLGGTGNGVVVNRADDSNEDPSSEAEAFSGSRFGTIGEDGVINRADDSKSA